MSDEEEVPDNVIPFRPRESSSEPTTPPDRSGDPARVHQLYEEIPKAESKDYMWKHINDHIANPNIAHIRGYHTDEPPFWVHHQSENGNMHIECKTCGHKFQVLSSEH